jgi:hypothetical protein
VGAGRPGGRLKVAIVANGPVVGELRYVSRQDGKILQVVNRSAAMPPPDHWRRGFLYLDEVPLAVGDVTVELVAPPRVPVTLPPGRFNLHAPAPPLAPPQISASAPLGSL